MYHIFKKWFIATEICIKNIKNKLHLKMFKYIVMRKNKRNINKQNDLLPI